MPGASWPWLFYRRGHKTSVLSFINRDNVEADILGANLYRRHLSGTAVPEPRRLPSEASLLPQTVSRVESILVSTGVHSSNVVSSKSLRQETVDDASQLSTCRHHCHRDFADVGPELFSPTVSVSDVKHAVEYILQQQHKKTWLVYFS